MVKFLPEISFLPSWFPLLSLRTDVDICTLLQFSSNSAHSHIYTYIRSHALLLLLLLLLWRSKTCRKTRINQRNSRRARSRSSVRQTHSSSNAHIGGYVTSARLTIQVHGCRCASTPSNKFVWLMFAFCCSTFAIYINILCYLNPDLGEKNLMWSLRGSQSEQILEKKMDSSGSDEEVTVVRRSRKLIEDSNSWISSLLRNAYPIYSARSDSMFEVQLKNILNTRTF